MTAAITDFAQFTSLRAGADRNDPAALREVATQFEALFVQSLLKNMRGAELAEPLFGGSEQNRMYQEMFDKQIAMEMASGRGIGLADMLVRQLGGEAVELPVTREVHMAPVHRAARTDGATAKVPAWSNPTEFAEAVWPHATRAAGALGVAPEAVLAQAALETGWGARVMTGRDGASSNNLFGIKASGGWRGDSVVRPTLEYRGGVAERSVERFRAYPDVGAAFDDYARLIGDQPRYRDVVGNGEDVTAFALALQRAGYATDPAYAAKIGRVAESDTMREALRELKFGGHRPTTTVNTVVAGP